MANFKFYDTFFNAINMLPEEERANACYEFCKFGVTGEIPKDKSLAMFCVGVSASVQKYQGRGGPRVGAGRPKNQNNQNNQNNQKNQNEQTETKTKTETKTESNINIYKKSYGEFGKVKLTDPEYEKLKESYGKDLDIAIGILDDYLASKGKKYSSHYAVMKKNGWVWTETMKQSINDFDEFDGFHGI